MAGLAASLDPRRLVARAGRQPATPPGAQELQKGLYRKFTPLPSGYVEEQKTYTDPMTGAIREQRRQQINPNQALLDTERARGYQQLELDRSRADQQRAAAPQQQAPAPTSKYSSYVYKPPGPGDDAMPQDDARYEDYVDESELQRLIALAKSGFHGSPVEREEDYLDQGLLSQLQSEAERRSQFQKEEYFDDPNARSQAFGRAKDDIGLINRSALDALREEMAATGRLGSGIEAQLGANILGEGARDLSRFSSDQAQEEVAGRRGVAQRNADRASSRQAQLTGLMPSLTAQSRKTRMVPGDPNAVMRQQESYLASLMPQLLKQAQRQRRIA